MSASPIVNVNEVPETGSVEGHFGKIMVRSLRAVGVLERTGYMHGEPEVPRVFQLAAERRG